MILRRNREHVNGHANGAPDVLLQMQFGQELAQRYERERIAIEVRAADVQVREARIEELRARVRALENALEASLADRRLREPIAADLPPDAKAPTDPNVVVGHPKGKRLGKQLVKRRVVTRAAVRQALKVQEETGGRLGEILVASGALSPSRLLEELAHQHGIALVETDDRGIGLIPADIALEQRAVALAVGRRPVADGAMAAVAFVDLGSAPMIASVLHGAIEPRLADAETVARLFGDAYSRPSLSKPSPQILRLSTSAPAIEAGRTNGHHPPEDMRSRNGTAPKPADAAPEASEPQAVAPAPEPAVVAEPEPMAAPDPDPEPVAAAPEPAAQAPVQPVSAPQPAPSRWWLGRRRRRSAARQAPPTVVSRPAAVPAPPAGAGAEEPATTLPTATLAVTLRRATSVAIVPLASELERLDYPRHRLQAMAVFDPADEITRRTLRGTPLPGWVAEVPLASPSSTGPRELLLHGAREATGELLVIVQSARQLESVSLRSVVLGQGTKRLVTLDADDDRGEQRLVEAYLRQAETMHRDVLGPENSGRIPQLVAFRTAELVRAFGWATADVV
jgi:hypothetical protein